MKRKIIYAITLLLGLSLFSFYAKAQNWQAYKGVWLKGYDNATQAPIPPTGYSALTYFADSLGTYVYDWDSLAWLRIPGTGGGGGGGGLVTADNGLIIDPAGNVRIGSTANPGNITDGILIAGPNLLFEMNETTDQIGLLQTGSLGQENLLQFTNAGTILSYTDGVSFPHVRLTSQEARMRFSSSDIIFVNDNFATMLSSPTRFDVNGAPETAVVSSTAGSQIQFNVATPASPLITTEAADNFTISKPQGLMSSSGSLQIGGPDGLVTSLENTESGNTAIFDVRGTNETFLMRSASGGSTLTTNVSNPGLVSLSATGSNAALIMQAEKGFQIFDPGLLVAGDGNNAQLQIGRLSGTGDDGVVRIYYTGRTGEIELGVLAGGPFIRGMEDNRTFRVEAVGANSNIVVKAGSGGFVIMEGLPTTDPCGSAPSGTVWDNSGVLSRCP